MFLSMCVLVTFLFQSVHFYSHFSIDYFGDSSHGHQHDKYANHHSDDCQICHFTFSPFTSVSTDVITFYANIYYPKLNVTYQESTFENTINFIHLRGPPVLV